MIKAYHSRFNCEVITIFPGEYYTDCSPAVITTLLGSCVSVILYDQSAGVGGMNHFMLPEVLDDDKFYKSSAGKYGMNAMELLINALLKKGAEKRNLKAKVFGGSRMFSGTQKIEKSISSSNISVALDYLSIERIPIVSSDTGGTLARRIYFSLSSFKVYMKKIQKINFD